MRGVYDYTIYSAARVGRRILALFVALFIIVIFSGDEVVAETKNETENAIRLVGGTGTVNVIDYNGKKAKVTSKMRLANGSTVVTEANSSAYINLDSTKSVKLDALTRAEVRKSKGKFDVLLNSGNLLFNVTAPLAQNEVFNVRTSNMTMAIRGTCAQVEVLDARHTRVCLLEGSLHCKITSLRTGESKTVVLLAGQSADFYINGRTENDCKIVTEDVSEKAIKGFVLQELYENKTLANKIYQQSGLDFRSITQTSINDKLKSEQKTTKTSTEKKNDNKKKAIQMNFLEDHSEGKLLYTAEGNVMIIPEDISVERWRAHNPPPCNGGYNQSQTGQNTSNENSGAANQSSRRKDKVKVKETISVKMKASDKKGSEYRLVFPSPQAEVVVKNYFDGQ